MADRCDLTDLLVEQCACPAHRNIVDTAVGALGPPFTATWPGRCRNCGDPFGRGARIRSAGEDGYLGPCCQETT